MCNLFLIYGPGFIPAFHLSPCMHSMDYMGKTAQGSHNTTAWWEKVSVQLGVGGKRMASSLTEKDWGVLVTDKLKTSQQCALVIGKPTTS